ncbi:uncharacterized protein LOC134241129 [Saccostrea cucullata]|uniref:uncharacterized protein LOC134241129 n=1 Tax=Saccostrea cuccullata TaxID=36930 RepID=UPI002ED22E16
MARRFNRRKKDNKSTKRIKPYFANLRRIKKWKHLNEARKYVLNLSKYQLNDNEYVLLAKGLKFIPTPKQKNVKRCILKDFDEFARKLRCKYHFDNGADSKIHPFRTSSGFQPPYTCSLLEEYIDKTKLELSSITTKTFQDNLTHSERNALSSLKKNLNVVIEKADKSNTTVIMDRNQYISEAERQLLSKHYMQVEKPNLIYLQDLIQTRINDMHSRGSIDKITLQFLKEKNPSLKCGQFYLLPKIHKLQDNVRNALINDLCSIRRLPPGRPIIAQCNTPTRKIGAYCDYFLIPIVQKQLTYIKDTTDFINKIEGLELPTDALLITYDVTSMYTNMEFEEQLNAVRNAYNNADKSNSDIPYPDVDDLIFLLRCVLENNYFEFNGKFYKQIIGCSMGAVPSPEISDMRMYEITQIIEYKFHQVNKILFHGRFRDDGFIIFNGTKEEILEFFDISNSCHKHLKFTFEIAHSSVNFLDTTVYKGNRFNHCQKLDIKSYIKPTNNFQYLHRNSAHNVSVFKGFIKGECIRHSRNTNDPSVLKTILQDFKGHLSKRGYSEEEINPIVEETTQKERQLFLRKREKTNSSHPHVMVTKFNPRVKGLKKRILKYWNILEADPTCKDLFKSEPIIAYSKHKNIGDLLIKSSLQ